MVWRSNENVVVRRVVDRRVVVRRVVDRRVVVRRVMDRRVVGYEDMPVGRGMRYRRAAPVYRYVIFILRTSMATETVAE